MEKSKYIYGGLAIVIIVILGIVAFNNKTENKTVEPQAMGQSTTQNAVLHTVTVEDFINTSNYTYIKVKENDKDFWIAVTKMDVKKGQTLYFSKSMEMKDFHSTELNRTFDSVLFVDGIATSKDQANPGFKHPEINQDAKENVSVKAYPGGKTVKDIFADKSSLSGKTVKIRGKVTKVNEGIMDRNWIHIQDGTSSNGEYDLLVTTKQTAKVGDIVAFEGQVVTNKDFGAGYSYDVMIENAKIIKENKTL
jgi:hypothetical protein